MKKILGDREGIYFTFLLFHFSLYPLLYYTTNYYSVNRVAQYYFTPSILQFFFCFSILYLSKVIHIFTIDKNKNT